MAALDAVVFDLYGTLLHIRRRAIHREVPRILGAPHDEWIALVRRLLLEPYADAAAFAHAIRERLKTDAPAEREAACLAAVEREVASVEVLPGVLPLCLFLKRRGFKLGVVSNLVSPHKAPFASSPLGELFDAAAFSCDEGIAKPDPHLYRRVLDRLGVEASRTLFVGDSLPNDVEAPAALGMRTAGVGLAGRDATLRTAAELGQLDISELPFRRLLRPGQELAVGGRKYRIASIAPVPDDELGRYNLVWQVEATFGDGWPATLFVKRFLLPETVHVEVLGYRLQAACGLPACEAAVVEGPEPLLAVTGAPGPKIEPDLGPAIAYELGRHSAFAFIFANADIRPRNAFAVENGGVPRVTFVDLEHCFFNLAIDVGGLADPLRPETFDRLPPDDLKARVKKQVLSKRASNRARRSFFDLPPEHEVPVAFRAGFLDFYRAQGSRTDALCELVAERIRSEPPLVIGTHAYRRAMAGIDLEDIRQRLAMQPEAAFDWCY